MSYHHEKRYNHSHITAYRKDDPTKVSAVYYMDERGHLHRDPDEGPAEVSYDDEGNVNYIRYMWRGHFHREDGPAYISSYHGKQPLKEIWYRYGHRHRDPADGPAYIQYDENGEGKIAVVRYYSHGYEFRDPRTGPATTVYLPDGEIECLYHSQFIPPRPLPSRRWLVSKFGFRT